MSKICLKKFREKYLEYNNITDNWLIWFIGFFEGDGCLTIGKKNIEIVVSQNELNKSVLFEMKDKFGFGQVLVQKKFNVPGKLWVYRYIVRDFKGQNVLLTLFHNNLVIPLKKHKYNNFIKIYNEKLLRAKERRMNKFSQLDLLNQSLIEPLPTSKDSWLCGFTDAEGCFYTSIISNGKIRACFDLTQKENKNHSCQNVFNVIRKDILKAGYLNFKKSKNTNSIYISIRSSSIKKDLYQLHKYFNQFILKTSKIYDFVLQKEIILRFNESSNFSDKEELINLIKHNKKNSSNRKKGHGFSVKNEE